MPGLENNILEQAPQRNNQCWKCATFAKTVTPLLPMRVMMFISVLMNAPFVKTVQKTNWSIHDPTVEENSKNDLNANLKTQKP